MHQQPHLHTTALGLHTRALVVVDPSVDGWPGLLEGLQDSTAVLVLEPHSHGLLQLTDHLRGLLAPLRSLHLIGHGSPGCMRLGAAELNLASLQTWAPHWQRVGQALDGEGELVLYGCALAKGPRGRQFIDALTTSVGAAVTASSRPVGAQAMAGGWSFDHYTGAAPSASDLHLACPHPPHR